MDKPCSDDEQIDALADLPSQEVLPRKLLGAAPGPGDKLVRLLNEPASQLARVLKAKADKDGEQSRCLSQPFKPLPAGGPEFATGARTTKEQTTQWFIVG